MRKLLTWYLLLNKRLLKKPAFLIFLIIIPLFVAVFQIPAQENSGVLSVVLASNDPQDAFTSKIIEQLCTESSVIAFSQESSDKAIELVQSGKADAAWIFPYDLASCMQAYAQGQQDSAGFIRVVEREQTIPLRLSREKLSGAIYEQISRYLYLQYLHQNAPQTENVDDQQLLEYLENTYVNGELFAFFDFNGNQRERAGNYLTSPLRGLLAIIVVIGSVVTAMYYQKDIDNGLLVLLPHRYHVIAEFGYQMISSVIMLCAVFAALLFSGISAGFWRELLLVILFSACSSLFGMVLRMFFGGRRELAVLLPILTVVMLVLCPVFFDFAPLRLLQYALPPTYYINGAYNYHMIIGLLLFDVVLLVLYGIGRSFRRLVSRE